MSREAAIEAGQDEILVNWSIWVTSRKAARNIAAAVIDAAAPHLKAEALREYRIVLLEARLNPGSQVTRELDFMAELLADRAERVERGEA